MNSSNVIVVPIYKSTFTLNEEISFLQCVKIFSGENIVVVKPESLNVTTLLEKFPSINLIAFSDDYFKDIHAYNSLMLSSAFYNYFLKYNYMLIYQLDAFVFSNQLNYWANMGYDYIGAPWLRELKNNNYLNRAFNTLKNKIYVKFNIRKNNMPKTKQFYNKVGNGGFSLRNIKKFHQICISKKVMIEKYLKLKDAAFNEDIFWSIEVNRHYKHLNIPNYKIAVNFSIETHPNFAFNINKNKLPFGCHAWEKNLPFWKQIINDHGYMI